MTELIWDGKYDDKGQKVAPPRIALPFQTVETVNESAADRDRMQDLFASGRPTEWRNRLYGATRSTCCRRCWRSLLEGSISSTSILHSTRVVGVQQGVGDPIGHLVRVALGDRLGRPDVAGDRGISCHR
jgi:hypothetical protein